MLSIKKTLVLLFVLCLVPLFSGCNQVSEDTNTNLGKAFFEKNRAIYNVFQKKDDLIFGKYSRSTTPDVLEVIAARLNADPSLTVLKKIKYKNFDGSKFDETQIDDGSFVVNDNFYVYINNDGWALDNLAVYFDINGDKGPNQFGYDLFGYSISQGDSLTPIGETADALENPAYFEE